MEAYFKKYDTKAPRYTSYPPIPYWKDNVDSKKWRESLRHHQSDIDLYVHIPFCRSLCYYCGCFRKVTKNEKISEEYLQALLKEYEIYKKDLGDRKIQSLHFGGGTPTFVPAELLRNWLQIISVDFSENFIGSVEVDPRTCTEDHLEVFKEFGFKKISLGIQDFDSEVQKAINREQSFDLVLNLIEKIRQRGFTSINFDLIWGLPKQTVNSVLETIKKVNILSPDQISFYSYAHLPEKIANQRLIKTEDILQGKEKRKLYDEAKKEILAGEMLEIGMDHYAKKDSFLAKAYLEGRLKRNFMGYVEESSETLIGLGVSSISSNKEAMIQNTKEMSTYYKIIYSGQIPFVRSHFKTNSDVLRDEIIQKLMCEDVLLKEMIFPFKEKIQLDLNRLVADNLLLECEDVFKVTSEGKKFIRYIASLFDEYLSPGQTKTFSQVV